MPNRQPGQPVGLRWDWACCHRVGWGERTSWHFGGTGEEYPDRSSYVVGWLNRSGRGRVVKANIVGKLEQEALPESVRDLQLIARPNPQTLEIQLKCSPNKMPKSIVNSLIGLK
jgi:hypothetical protein